MKKKFTFLIAAALMLLTMMASTGTMLGQSDYSTDYTGNITLSTEGGSNASACVVIIGGTNYNGIKAGTSKNAGAVKITVPSGTKYLHLHLAAWNNETVSLAITPTGYSDNIALTNNSGISNNSPFTFNGDPSTSDYYKVITFASAMTADTDLTFTATGGKRFVVWGVTSEEEGSGDDPSISADDVELAYDATWGEIEYTINNPATSGNLTAEVTAGDWLENLQVGETVTFNCDPNSNAIARTATVKLTYTYSAKATVTKNVTVTQAGNPDGPGSANNPYTVAQARAAIDAGTGTQGVYARGIVSEIVTAYGTGGYNNMTFNMVDEAGDEVFLQAYRCGGDEAPNVLVGDIAVVTGNLTKYGQTYEFASGCSVVSLEHPSTPYITADDVEITYDTDADEIEYEIVNPVDGGVLTASTTSDWLTLGDDFSSPIAFTCTLNQAAASRTATVTLTYTYNAKATVTKNVTVTQAGNPNIFDNITDITEVGTAYSVKGTVVAVNTKGFIMGDGTGYVYTYLNAAPEVAVGNMITVSGTTGSYGHVIQFTNTATIAEATTSNYDGTPEVSVITEVPDYSEGYHLSTYLQFEGGLTKSGSNYIVAVGSSQIRISYPTTDQGTELAALENKTVRVHGFFSGISGSGTNAVFTATMESIEEVVVTTPSITVSPATVNAPFAGADGSLTITYENIPDLIAFDIQFCDANGDELQGDDPDWIDAEINEPTSPTDNYTVYYVIGANDGEARNAYFKVYTYVGANLDPVYSNLITVNQAEYVAPSYAELPFAFNGGKADIETTDGLTQEGLGSDYNATSNPTTKLKFDGSGDWLLLQFQERPGTLTFNIKGNSFSGSTFKVQTSEDGITYTDLETYTELGDTQDESFDNLGENVRYIKWIYTEKSSGNVGLGNIALAEYAEPVASITVTPATVDVTAEGENDGILPIAYQYLTITEASDFDIQYYDANNQPLSKDDEPDWMGAAVQDNATQDGYEVSYFVSENDGEARTAYFKVYALDANMELVYSNLITVSQEAYVAPTATITVNPDLVEATAEEAEGSLGITLENITISQVEDHFEVYFCDENGTILTEGKPNWLIGEVQLENNEFSLYYMIDENTSTDTRTAYMKVYGLSDDGNTEAYSNIITFTQAAPVTPPGQYDWVLTDLEDLTDDDVFVIIGDNGDTYAMSNNNGTSKAPATVAVTIVNDNITSSVGDTIQWKLSGNSTNGYTFYPNGSTTTWLYCNTTAGSSSNNNMRVGTGNRSVFEMNSNNFLLTKDDYTARYLSIYDNADWRGYTNANLCPEISYYKRVPASTEPSITITPASFTLNADGGDAVIPVVSKNLADEPQLAVIFVEEDGETPATYDHDWISANINGDGNIAGHIDVNEGAQRTAYFKVSGLANDNTTTVYSNLVTVTQQAAAEPSIVFNTTTLDINAGGENRTLSFDYEGLGQNPTFSINFYESDGTTSATYDWCNAELVSGDNKVDVIVDANTGEARSAYFKVQGVNGAVSTESNLVTINQEAAGQTVQYALITSADDLTPGYHYLIVSGTNGDVKAMGEQKSNNRGEVGVTVANGVITNPQGVFEFVISGNGTEDLPATIYDENIPGYLYAAGTGSSNYLKTQDAINDRAQWTITIGSEYNAIITALTTATDRKIIRYNSNSSVFSCYGSGQQPIYLFKKVDDTPVYYSPTEVAVADPNPTSEPIIVVNNEILVLSGDLSNCTNPDNLIIQDGGQLVFEGDGVMATMLKSTAHAGAKDGVGDWYTIASPLKEDVTTSTSNTNLTTGMSSSEYDLYRYDEATAVWENSKIGANSTNFSEIELGRGYLYWREDGQDLFFAGELNNEDVNYTLTAGGTGNLKGFNLIGNPFSQNITMANIGGVSLTGGYVLTKAGGWGATVGEIAPCQGFLVQVENEANITISKNTDSKSRENRDYIEFTMANSQYEDVTYAMFDGGTGLHKISHRNNNIPMVYIPQNGADYAIATMDNETGAFNLNVKAMTTGQYTLTMNAIGKYDYIHVIDRMTGEDIDMLVENEYTFVASPRDNENRFIVKLRYNAGDNDVIGDSFAYQNGSDIIINGEGELQVFDITGRFVMSRTINGNESISTDAFNTGVYVFRMIGSEVKTQKIVVR